MGRGRVGGWLSPSALLSWLALDWTNTSLLAMQQRPLRFCARQSARWSATVPPRVHQTTARSPRTSLRRPKGHLRVAPAIERTLLAEGRQRRTPSWRAESPSSSPCPMTHLAAPVPSSASSALETPQIRSPIRYRHTAAAEGSARLAAATSHLTSPRPDGFERTLLLLLPSPHSPQACDEDL